jgi:hypothetical protein
MRPPLPLPFWPAAVVALSAALASCHQPDSILLVEVSGNLALMPAGFLVTVTSGQTAARDFHVAPASGGAVSLPASFSVELPADVTGPVVVAVQALDANQCIVAKGTATQRDLNVGGQTILSIALAPTDCGGGSLTPDAGTAGATGLDGGGDAGASDGGTKS